jgi:hypothetical protein
VEVFGDDNHVSESGCAGIQIKDDEVRLVEVLDAR